MATNTKNDMFILRTPNIPPAMMPGLTLDLAQRIAPFLAKGCYFAKVVEEPVVQLPLDGVTEAPVANVPVTGPKPRYKGDDDKDRGVLIHALGMAGKALSSGDLEAATGIPSSVVRRLLIGQPAVMVSGAGRGTKYSADVAGKLANPDACSTSQNSGPNVTDDSR